MGRKSEFSKARKHLMKHLKTLSAKLDESPNCRVQPFYYQPHCLSSGPPKCRCFLVPNCNSSSTSPSECSGSCGPFPDSFSAIQPSRLYCIPCTSYPYALQPSFCSPMTYCSRCNCLECPHNNCCFQKLERYSCEPKYCPHSFCNNRIRFKKCPASCGCHSICLPRCKSDSAFSKQCSQAKILRCSKSVELRGGVLHKGCVCDKKNGLQDCCSRYCCINNPKCKTEPASCHCSKFSCGKHLERRYGGRRSSQAQSYTCYINCEPPKCSCMLQAMMPCFPMMPCRRNCFCNRKKLEYGCQCCPSTCEVECSCSKNLEEYVNDAGSGFCPSGSEECRCQDYTQVPTDEASPCYCY